MEKIKINLNEETYKLLLSDAKSFEITKKDGSVNLNAFLNKLIRNYFQKYEQNIDLLSSKVANRVISEILTIKKQELLNLTNDIVRDVFELKIDKEKDELTKTIAVKPVRETIKYFILMENNLKGFSFSAYLRGLFSFYALLPFNKREQVIFKDEYELISSAINRGKKILFTLNKVNIVSPYTIVSSKDELFNFVIGVQSAQTRSNVMTYRLSRIKEISILDEVVDYSDHQVDCMKKMIEQGPQYIIYSPNSELIKIRLTDNGIKLYNAMYLYRPKVIKIEGNDYYFDCSDEQIVKYFIRFNADALIIEPVKLRRYMYSILNETLQNYRDLKPL